MDIVIEYLGFSMISWPEVMLRAALSLIFGMFIGWDRGRKKKPIDFRVYMIVCLTSCIVAIMGQELLNDYPAPADQIVRMDLSKLMSGVLTGIGFLGAGAIIKRSDDIVVGTATAACIWASGGIGLTLGFGLYGLALIAFICVAIILVMGGLFMENVQDKDDAENKDMTSG